MPATSLLFSVASSSLAAANLPEQIRLAINAVLSVAATEHLVISIPWQDSANAKTLTNNVTVISQIIQNLPYLLSSRNKITSRMQKG
jgi:hypothetical protein